MSGVFLCWSKERSKALAKGWELLLPEIASGAKPIISTQFQKGKEWRDTLRRHLDDVSTGIVFLTPENVDSPWIHFEAGALASAVEGRNGDVFTYVYGFDPGRLGGPLSAYQSTLATKEDTQRLVRDLCAALRCKAPTQEEYSKWWAKLEVAIEKIPPPGMAELVPGFARLFERKTFLEPLPDCTNQRWLDRFAAARGVHEVLLAARHVVEDRGRPGSIRLYQELIAAVDGYAMAMSGFLVREERFGFDDQGKLGAPPGAIMACEVRRKKVNDLAALLADPKNDTPVFEESVMFEELEAKQRKSLIHRWEVRLERGDATGSARWLAAALNSDYEFDRIAAYVYREKRRPPQAEAGLAAVRREFEKRRIDPAGSYMPLHYSLRSLRASRELKDVRDKLEDELTAICELLSKTGKQPDDALFAVIAEIRKAVPA